MLRKFLCITLVFTFAFLSFQQAAAGGDAEESTAAAEAPAKAEKEAKPAKEAKEAKPAKAATPAKSAKSAKSAKAGKAAKGKSGGILDLIFKPLLAVPKTFASAFGGLISG